MPYPHWNRSKIKLLSHGEKGNVQILVAFLLAMLLGFGGLVLDYGQAAAKHRQAQNAADGAAQGAAYEIYAGTTEAAATTEANLMMTLHSYTSANLTKLQYLDSSMASTTDPTAVTYVRAEVTETFNNGLMGVLGIKTSTISAGATVKVGTGTAPCALCLLDYHNGLTGSGSEIFQVTGGNIWINADGTSATTSGSEQIRAPVIGMDGTGYTWSGTNPYTQVLPTVNAGRVADPLAKLQAPSVAGSCSGTLVITSSRTLSPGVYCGIVMSGSGTLTFSAGIYVFTGSIVVSGSWLFYGRNVMLYLTCSGYSTTNTEPCAGSSGAGLTWSGSTTYDLKAPTTGTYKGMAIYYDRTNTAGLTLSGTNNDHLTGTIYAKQAAVTLSGGGSTTQINSLVVVGSATVSGSSNFNLVYNQSENYSAAQLPVFTE